MSDIPQDHPDPDRWWRAIQKQSTFCYIVMAAEIPLLALQGIGQHEVMPLVLVNLGLVSGAVAYGGGSTLIDAIKAWRG
jgi:hypothetical protein